MAVGVLAVLILLQGIHRLALGLDYLLFPRFGQQPVRVPLFIVGPPRNGTTLLHRLLASQTGVFTTLKLWELLFAPAICEKYFFVGVDYLDARLGRPLRRLLLTLQRPWLQGSNDVHDTSLLAPEEDYLALMYYRACFLLVVAFPHCPAVWRLGRFDHGIAPDIQSQTTRAYRGLLQRHLFVFGNGRTILSKNPAFCSWIGALQQEFPDARFVAPLRNPVEAVASQLSSLRDTMQWLGNDVRDPTIVAEFVDLLAHYYTQLTDRLSRLPAERAIRVSYRELTDGRKDFLIDMLEQLGYSPSRDLAPWTTAVQQARSFRTRHRYTLQDYGLSPDLILERIPDSMWNRVAPQPAAWRAGLSHVTK